MAQQELEIQLSEEVGQGTYANLAIITHSGSEFVMDFARMMPRMPKATVASRIVMAPEHAKRLLFALQENLMKYEKTFGQIRLPEQRQQDPKTIAPFNIGNKGEA